MIADTFPLAADTDVLRRFWEKVMPEPTSGCWLWIGGSHDDGYGRFWFEGRVRPAHRVIYELLVGPIPDGLHIDHLCRTPACVNPAHLEPVTVRLNLLRGDTLPSRQSAQTHCKRGHEFTPENTRLRSRGNSTLRECRACRREMRQNGRWS